MENLPHVIWLRAFHAAARHNSFAAAANELGITAAAVSQQIKLLEQHLDARLFKRLPRGVVLTDVGQAYAQTVGKGFDDMAVATRGLFGISRKRTVCVRASISYAVLVIAPKLAEFKAAYPDITVQIATSVWADRFDDDWLDVDIRYGHGDWPEAHILHLGHESAVPVCHPDYAASMGRNPSIQSLASAEVVEIIGSETDWGQLSQLHNLQLEPRNEWIKADSSLIALQIVSAGKGLTMVLESFAAQYLEQGKLIQPTAYKLPKRRSHYLVVSERAQQRDEVTIFSDWVRTLYHDPQITHGPPAKV